MTPVFDQNWQKIAFIAALCSRHQINYSLFCETVAEPHKGQIYAKLLNKVWEYLADQLTSMKNLEKALLQLEDITPEPTDDDGYGIYPALDACLLLTSALQMILDDSIDDLDVAAPLSLATVSQFIEFSEDMNPNSAELSQHTLYKEEVDFQKQLAVTLNSQSMARLALIKQLRRDLNDYPYSNLGIVL